MKFHKYTFPIRMIENYGVPIEYMTGWANEDNSIGFCKSANGNSWRATDCYTGMRLCTCSTRKECVEWIEKNTERIQAKMCEPKYFQRVNEFKELLLKEKEKFK